MSNKVNVSHLTDDNAHTGFSRNLGQLSGDDMREAVRTKGVSGTFHVTPSVGGAPVDGLYWTGRIDYPRDGRIFVEVTQLNAPGLGDRYYSLYIDGEWTDWIGPLATATPPQEYDLPLAAGMTGTARYCKDQFGYVHIRGWVGGVDAVASVTPLITTLPAGYRPAISSEAILPVSSADNTLMAYRLKIFDTGEMRALSATDRSRVTKGISIDVDFRAA